MTKIDRIVTETWKDKRYEDELTKLWIGVRDKVELATTTPTIEYMKIAYAATKKFCKSVLWSKDHLPMFNKQVVPVLDDICKILYGDHRLPSVQAKAREYGVRIVQKFGKDEIEAGALLINQLDDLIFLCQQWALEEGLFFPKPQDRKYGTDAIRDVLEQ